MADYKIVKYCKLCKKRFVVNKGEVKKYYCSNCEGDEKNTSMEMRL